MKWLSKNYRYLIVSTIIAITSAYLPVSMANNCSVLVINIHNHTWQTLARQELVIDSGDLKDGGAKEIDANNGSTTILVIDKLLEGPTMTVVYGAKETPKGPVKFTIKAAQNRCVAEIGNLNPYPTVISNNRHYAGQVTEVKKGSFKDNRSNIVEIDLYATIPSK